MSGAGGAPALSSFGESIFAEEKAPEAEPEPAPVETKEVVTLHAKHRPPPYLLLSSRPLRPEIP